MSKRIVFSFLTMLFLVSLSATQVQYGAGSESSKADLRYLEGSYNCNKILHGPIRINGNYEFSLIASMEGWPGNGSASNPYIIEGYEIDGNGGSFCIWISDTDVYFIIRNCKLRNATDYMREPYGSAIALRGVKNGIIINNTCEYVNYGIMLYRYSEKNTIKNNIINYTYSGLSLSDTIYNSVSNNYIENVMIGVSLSGSYNETITNNYIFGRVYRGIELYYSKNISIYNNEIYNCTDAGIYFFYSYSCNLSGNKMKGCGIVFEGERLSLWNTHYIDTTNVVNGKPVIYVKNKIGITISTSNVGQLIVVNCTDIKVENLDISETSVGICVAFSNKINIKNVISKNSSIAGIYLYESEKVIISKARILYNHYGIYMIYSKNNIIEYTEVAKNIIGIFLWNANNNIIFNSTAYYNDDGFMLYESYNCTVYNNTVFSNARIGMSLYLSRYDTIGENKLLDNGVAGIFLINSYNITIERNRFYNDGILIEGDSLSHWNTHQINISNTVNDKPIYYYKNIVGGSISSSRIGQLIIVNCTNFRVSGITVSNTSVGVMIAFSSHVLIENASIYNSSYGILLSTTNYSTITYCDIFDNKLYGVYMWISSYNNLKYNSLKRNMVRGISITLSVNNNVLNNVLEFNTEAISLDSSHYNIISNNSILNNTHGICIIFSNNNIITYNWIIGNSYYGVCIFYGSSENKIHHNNFIDNNKFRGLIGRSQAYDDGLDNYWFDNSIKEGNYWSNWDGSGWGTPSAYPIDGGAGASDWYPLKKPVREWSLIIMLYVAILVLVLLSHIRTDNRHSMLQKV